MIGIPSVYAAQKVLFAENAGKVNNISASRTAKPNTLLALDAKGTVAASAIPMQTKLRPNQTVRGVIGGTFTATANRQTFGATASIWPAAPKGILIETTGIGLTPSENPFCEGDVNRPTAPQGLLCIYLANEQFLNVSQDCTPGPFPNCTSGEGVYRVAWDPINGSQNGFAITWENATPGRTALYGTWAYTAPVKGLDPGAPVE